MRIRAFFLLVLASFLLTACMQREKPRPEPNTETQISNQEEEEVMDAKELIIEDLSVGNGEEAREGDKIQVHYTGTLIDGTKFDSSLDRDESFEFTLGAGRVIKGWDIGVQGMKVGGKRRLTIPPQFAYGEREAGDIIPANATLIFEIVLLAVNPDTDSSK